MSNLTVFSEREAELNVKREMQRICQAMGIPTGLPGIYHIVSYKENGKTFYKAMWGKTGYTYLLHFDLRGHPSIMVNQIQRANKENGGLAIASCHIKFADGSEYYEEGDADNAEFPYPKYTAPNRQANTMARTRAMERCAMLATANGLSLIGQARRVVDEGHTIDRPVVVEVTEDDSR